MRARVDTRPHRWGLLPSLDPDSKDGGKGRISTSFMDAKVRTTPVLFRVFLLFRMIDDGHTYVIIAQSTRGGGGEKPPNLGSFNFRDVVVRSEIADLLVVCVRVKNESSI